VGRPCLGVHGLACRCGHCLFRGRRRQSSPGRPVPTALGPVPVVAHWCECLGSDWSGHCLADDVWFRLRAVVHEWPFCVAPALGRALQNRVRAGF
jgi:hypothetical protein